MFYASTLGPRVLQEIQPEVSSLSGDAWWASGVSIPPGSENRSNFQFAGDADALASALRDAGWVDPPPATWKTPLAMLNPEPDPSSLPLLPEGYNNRREGLVLSLPEASADQQMVLRLWSTGARLAGETPVYAGQLGRYELAGVLYFFQYWKRSELLEPLERLEGFGLEWAEREELTLFRFAQSD